MWHIENFVTVADDQNIWRVISPFPSSLFSLWLVHRDKVGPLFTLSDVTLAVMLTFGWMFSWIKALFSIKAGFFCVIENVFIIAALGWKRLNLVSLVVG